MGTRTRVRLVSIMGITPTAALRDLEQTEARLRLWQRKPYGFPVWPMLRLGYYRRALEGKAFERSRPARESLPAQLALASASVIGLGPCLWRPNRARDIIVLSSTMYRRRDSSGKPTCLFTGHLQKQLPDRLQFLEINTGNLRTPEAPDELCFTNAFYQPVLRLMRPMAKLGARAFSREDVRAFTEARQPEAFTLGLHGRLLYEAAKRWFAFHRPRAVFVLCGYSRHTPVQLAAKASKVPVIELQHGVIHENHPGYVFPKLSPAVSWRTLPTPDHIVVFGRDFGNLLERTSPYWRGRWSVGGHPMLRSARPAPVDQHVFEVCFFSQTEARVRACVLELASELRCRAARTVRIALKPHPGEKDAKTFYQRLETEGVALLDPFDDTYDLLRRTRVSVGVHSTVVIEALAFGCQSAAIRSDTWTDAISSLVNQRRITPVSTAAEVLDLLERPPTTADGTAANALFGIGEPELDFERLVTEVAARVSIETR